MRQDRFTLGLALVTLLAAVVRILVAAGEPPHFDESYTAVHYVQTGLSHLLSTYDEPNNHLFHSLLAHLSTSVFGDGPFALRLPALLAGVALVPATGLLAHRAVLATAAAAAASIESTEESSPRAAQGAASAAGIIAAMIVAGAPPLIAYSANARGYSIALLLLVAQLLIGLRLTEHVAAARAAPEPPEPRWVAVLWPAWIAAGALAVWTVPTAVMGVFLATIWLVGLRWGGGALLAIRDPLLALVATGIASLALYAPVAGQHGFSVERFSAPPVRELVTTLLHAWTAGAGAPLLLVAVLLAAFGVARRPRFGLETSLAVGLLAIPLTIALLGRVPPYSRTYLFLWPVLAVLAGVGAARRVSVARGRPPQASPTLLLLAAVAVLSVGSAVFAQTRDAWGEDPPGPPYAATVAAIRVAGTAALAPADPRAAATEPGTLQLLSPPFTLPQLGYAASGFASTPVLGSVAPDAPGPWLLITRDDVDVDDAIVAVGLDPATVTPTVVGRDPLVLRLARR